MSTIDTRGLSCPQPVLLVLQALKGGEQGPFTVIVDNDCSLENVTRAAQNRGYEVQAEGIAEAEMQQAGLTRLVLTALAATSAS